MQAFRKPSSLAQKIKNTHTSSAKLVFTNVSKTAFPAQCSRSFTLCGSIKSRLNRAAKTICAAETRMNVSGAANRNTFCAEDEVEERRTGDVVRGVSDGGRFQHLAKWYRWCVSIYQAEKNELVIWIIRREGGKAEVPRGWRDQEQWIEVLEEDLDCSLGTKSIDLATRRIWNGHSVRW